MSGQTSGQPSSENLDATAGIEVEPLTEWIGADIKGTDLSQTMNEAVFEAIHEAWFRHLVLCFRGQNLSDADLVRFSRNSIQVTMPT